MRHQNGNKSDPEDRAKDHACSAVPVAGGRMRRGSFGGLKPFVKIGCSWVNAAASGQCGKRDFSTFALSRFKICENSK
jgi:hypothetical protein